jgi:hypothetical protein
MELVQVFLTVAREIRTTVFLFPVTLMENESSGTTNSRITFDELITNAKKFVDDSLICEYPTKYSKPTTLTLLTLTEKMKFLLLQGLIVKFKKE